jgi:hypothetical protein
MYKDLEIDRGQSDLKIRSFSYENVKLSLCLIKHHTMKTCGDWRYNSTILDLVTRWRWVVSFIPGERAPSTRWLRGWVGPRAGLHAVKNRKPSCPCRELNPGRPAVVRRYTDWVIAIPAQEIPFIIHWYNPNSKFSLDCPIVFHIVHYQKPITVHDMIGYP